MKKHYQIASFGTKESSMNLDHPLTYNQELKSSKESYNDCNTISLSRSLFLKQNLTTHLLKLPHFHTTYIHK